MNDDWIRDAGRSAGAIAPRTYRVVTIEADARVATHDFEDRDRAVGYANDAASEGDGPSPLAWVLDDQFRVVHRGRHYAAPGD